MTVTFEDAEPNGLAEMVGGLIRANLERDPAGRRVLLSARVGIVAPDAGVSITLAVSPAGVRIANGLGRRLDLRVTAPSAALLELTTVPLRLGLPDVATAAGRTVLRRLLSGGIRVRGLVRHPGKLSALTRLLTVA